MHFIIITLTALLGLGLIGHGGFVSTHGGSSSATAPHARAAMDVQPGGGPS
ncbi:MAG TPA: hypothetical protein VK669_11060 [Candidatus Limnocylindrales bacterium]|nr:hypothetical protein [Candidatus Limnocylindrales bacterium]